MVDSLSSYWQPNALIDHQERVTLDPFASDEDDKRILIHSFSYDYGKIPVAQLKRTSAISAILKSRENCLQNVLCAYYVHLTTYHIQMYS